MFRTSSPGLRRAIEREAGLSAEAFSARSALHHAEKIRSEIFILHGMQDDRAPADQAEAMAAALSVARRPVELHIFDCGHDISAQHSQAVLRPFLERIFGSRPTRH